MKRNPRIGQTRSKIPVRKQRPVCLAPTRVPAGEIKTVISGLVLALSGEVGPSSR